MSSEKGISYILSTKLISINVVIFLLLPLSLNQYGFLYNVSVLGTVNIWHWVAAFISDSLLINIMQPSV